MTNTSDVRNFGTRVQLLREQRKWSQAELGVELAHTAGRRKPVSQTTVWKWESGTSQPSNANIEALCRVFGVTYGYLMHGEGSPPVVDADRERIKQLEAELEALKRATAKPELPIHEPGWSGVKPKRASRSAKKKAR